MVWTRVRSHGSGMGYVACFIFECRLLDHVWLKTRASAIVCTFRARWRRAIVTLFQTLATSWYSFISWKGRRFFSASSRLVFTGDYALAWSQNMLMMCGFDLDWGKRVSWACCYWTYIISFPRTSILLMSKNIKTTWKFQTSSPSQNDWISRPILLRRAKPKPI